MEKFISRSIHPMPVNRGRLRCRNLPELRKPAKMVQPDEIACLRRPAQALDPPAIPVGTNRVPVIEGISPALAGGAEVVRRHSGNDFRLQCLLAQPEQMPVRPHIRAIVIHKNRDVANHTNRLLRTVMANGAPLLPEEELRDLSQLQIVSGAFPEFVKRPGIATRKLPWPLTPVAAVALP